MKSILFLLSLLISTHLHAQGFLPVANIVKIKGDVFINKEKVAVGAEIASGMLLSVPRLNDHAVIKFQNGHLIRYSGTGLLAEEINPKEGSFKLLNGKVFAIIRALTPNEKMSIKTDKAVIVAQEARFFIDEIPQRTYLSVSSGAISVEKGDSRIEVGKDQELRATTKGKLKKTVPSRQLLNLNHQVYEEMERP